ncbi:MAG: NAD(P)-binding domain-containing protein [Hyphomicrobiales bacterium]|nr:NAD(P)-binding domain-containing protein [Hyphomicrobiales bacterium]
MTRSNRANRGTLAPPRIAVIGAGPCGLTTVKNLLQAGLDDIACFEEGDVIGGQWAFRENKSKSAVYQSTHIISSKRFSSFADFPMPKKYPDFPSHRQILAYFEQYAAHFKVMPHVRLRSRVDRARPDAEGRWRLWVMTPEGRSEETFDYLLVCSGHHWDPHMPDYPGRFDGESLHSHAYKRPEPFEGKRVLVVGGGNSACDIAVDIGRVAKMCAISMRRGYYIMPKLLFGAPADTALWRLRHLPKPLRQIFAGWLVRAVVGRWQRYGLQPPEARLMEMHPTLNSDILNALRHGTVLPRAGIEVLDGRKVRFRNGREDEFDIVIWATGYRVSLPFLDISIVGAEPSEPPPLYLKMMPAEPGNLFFIGLFQPIGCIWTLADLQARIAALRIAGALEAPANLAARIDREARKPHWRFEKRPRHALEVDFNEFRKELLAEIARARPEAWV